MGIVLLFFSTRRIRIQRPMKAGLMIEKKTIFDDDEYLNSSKNSLKRSQFSTEAASSSFLGNSGDEEEEETSYDSGARIYETDEDDYNTYKNKVDNYYVQTG